MDAGIKSLEGRMNLFLIPARSGSKGLPGKNVLTFHGKPLLAWTIAAAREAAQLSRAQYGLGYVTVSTDSEHIAEIACEHGATAIYRPADLAADDTPMSAVIDHALKTYTTVDTVVLLQPTSPLRKASDIIKCMDRLRTGAVVSVCEAEHPPYWTAQLPPDGCVNVFSKAYDSRRQGTRYHRLNGAVFAARVDYFRCYGFFGPDSFAYEMPRERSVDIDTIEDFRYAELVAKYGDGYSRPADPDSYGEIY